MGKWFDDSMTSREVDMLFFSLLDGKTQEEIEEIKKEYSKIIPAILDRELKENDGWFADD